MLNGILSIKIFQIMILNDICMSGLKDGNKVPSVDPGRYIPRENVENQRKLLKQFKAY